MKRRLLRSAGTLQNTAVYNAVEYSEQYKHEIHTSNNPCQISQFSARVP